MPGAQPDALFVTSTAEQPAWRNGPAQARFWLVAVLGLSLDLWSKWWAFQRYHQGGHEVIIPRVLEFQTMFNKGALFGIGQGQTTLFLIASMLALGLVLWMFVRGAARRWFLQIALGAILAGALGNMYDRVYVRLYDYRLPSGQVVYVQKVGERDGAWLMREYPVDHERSHEWLIRPVDVHKVGCVRDFIKIPTKLWGQRDLWPWVFNVADMLLVGGVGVLAIYLWRDGRRHVPAAEPDAELVDSAGEAT